MKLYKLFSMTAALLIGAGTTALMADDDPAHLGDRDRNHGEHARGDHDKRKVASSRLAQLKKSAEARKRAASAKKREAGRPSNDRIAEMKKRALEARKRAASSSLGSRGQAGSPQQVIEIWKKRREAAQRGGRGPQARGGFKGFGGPRGPQARGSQAGPPQQVIEMWKKRREAAQRGGRGPQARCWFKGFDGPRGPQARGGHKGPRGPKGRQARGGRGDHSGPKGKHSERVGRRGHRR